MYKTCPRKKDPDKILKSLCGSVVSFINPNDSVGQDDWSEIKRLRRRLRKENLY